jgi:hypothetical protein
MQQRVLVALIGRLGIQDVRSDTYLCCFSGNGSHGGWSETHTTPLGRHMWKPHLCIVTRFFAEIDD